MCVQYKRMHQSVAYAHTAILSGHIRFLEQALLIILQSFSLHYPTI